HVTAEIAILARPASDIGVHSAQAVRANCHERGTGADPPVVPAVRAGEQGLAVKPAAGRAPEVAAAKRSNLGRPLPVEARGGLVYLLRGVDFWQPPRAHCGHAAFAGWPRGVSQPASLDEGAPSFLSVPF